MLIRTLARLDRLVEEKVFCAGAQLYVEVAGVVVADVAVGECAGRPVRPESLQSAYCLTKPLLPLAIAALVDEGLVSFDDPIACHAEAAPICEPHTTLDQLLSHRAGLRNPTASQWRMTEPEARSHAFIEHQALSDGNAYSELAAGFLLARVVERHRGCDAAAWITGSMLAPLGIEGDVIVEPDRALGALRNDKVLVPIGGLPDEQIPMLSEQLPAQVRECAAYFGGLVSMRGIGRLYGRLSTVLDGQRVDGLPSPAAIDSLLACRRARVHDATLHRACAFAGGFMVGLADHGISRLASTRAIAHAAGFINAVGTADPEQEIALALYLNGVTLNPDDLAYARTSIVDSVIQEVRDGRA